MGVDCILCYPCSVRPSTIAMRGLSRHNLDLRMARVASVRKGKKLMNLERFKSIQTFTDPVCD